MSTTTKGAPKTGRRKPLNSACEFDRFLSVALKQGFSRKSTEAAWHAIVERAKGASYGDRKHALTENVTFAQLQNHANAGRIPSREHGHMRGDTLKCANKVLPALLASL